MVRTLEFSCDPGQTERLVAAFLERQGVMSVSVQRGASRKPPGDVVRVHAHRDEALALLAALRDDPARPQTLWISSPTGVAAPAHEDALDRQSLEGAWEESVMLLRRETNPRFDFLALMALAGAVAAVGLWTDTLHLVVGAMVIAPGFQPFVRLPLGMLVGRRVLARRALLSVAGGYLALAGGAAAGWAVMRAVEGEVRLASLTWVSYWSTPTFSGAMLAVVAGAAGVLSILVQRSVLSAGAMVALALVPSASLVPMALLAQEADVAAGAALRWLLDAVIVTAVGFAVLGARRLTSQARSAL